MEATLSRPGYHVGKQSDFKRSHQAIGLHAEVGQNQNPRLKLNDAEAARSDMAAVVKLS